MYTKNTFASLRTNRPSLASTIQDKTYHVLGSLVNMHGADLSVHSF